MLPRPGLSRALQMLRPALAARGHVAAVHTIASARAAAGQRPAGRTGSRAHVACHAWPGVHRAYSSGPAGAEVPSKIWSFEELQTMTKNPKSTVVLVDVREPGELAATGHIPGAINIPVTSSPDGFFLPEDDFEDRFGFQRPARDAEIVFYCKAGVRSRAAAGLAREAGWTNVGEYPGSWLDWAGNGGAIEH